MPFWCDFTATENCFCLRALVMRATPPECPDGAPRRSIVVGFTSIPERGFDQFKDIARQRKLFPRDVFGDAVRQLLLDRAAGKEITYLASRKGGVRRSLWLEDDLVEGMAEAAQEDNVGKTSFFLTALARYAEKEGIDVEF
jgi:hypothetical protein